MMNPHDSSNQNPATASAVQQVNSVVNQQMCNGNGGGLFPTNRPNVAPPSFMNFPNQPLLLHHAAGQFPIGGFNPQQNFNPFPVNQFNPSQQQQGQFFAQNSMNPTAYNQNVGFPNEQVILQNAIQNICQLLQLQNPGYAQPPSGNFPMFQNQIANFMSQNAGFLPNQQFGLSSSNGPLQHANQQFQGQQRFVSPLTDGNAAKQLPNMDQQLQANPFLPQSCGLVQTQQASATLTNFQHQIAHSMGPHDQLYGMANSNGPGQHVNQGQQRFLAPMVDVNNSRQIASTNQQGSVFLSHASASVPTHNPHPTLTNLEDNYANMPANVNAGGAESQCKNFTRPKKNDASHKGFKSQFQHAKHAKEKFGTYNGSMNKESNSSGAVKRNSTNQTHFVNKGVKYNEQEVKQWREARKKHYPTCANVEKKEETLTNQEATLRRQELQEILRKQAELGCEVADIPSSYLREPVRRNQYTKGKFDKKNRRGRGRACEIEEDDDGMSKDNSLLHKLLRGEIKREKRHILQVLRFIAINSFFSDKQKPKPKPEPEPLRFPCVIVRDSDPEVKCNDVGQEEG